MPDGKPDADQDQQTAAYLEGGDSLAEDRVGKEGGLVRTKVVPQTTFAVTRALIARMRE